LREAGVPSKWIEQPVRFKLPDQSGAVKFLNGFKRPFEQSNTVQIERLGSNRRVSAWGCSRQGDQQQAY
jgi:hypothetical protein